MEATSEQILSVIWELAKAGAAGGAAVFLYQHLAKSWIDNRFAQRLEHFKHQQALEVQRLRVEIDSMLSGTLKIQEKEYEVLPQIWGKLFDAISLVNSLVNPLHRFPDLDRMRPAQLEEFLSNCRLKDSEKQDVRDSERKVNRYQEIIFWHDLMEAQNACVDLHQFTVRYGIFLPPHLKDQFDHIAKELFDAVFARERGESEKDYKLLHEVWQKLTEVVNPQFEAIGRETHLHLQSHAGAAKSADPVPQAGGHAV